MSVHNVFVTNGASNHASFDRVDGDYYATDPACVDALAKAYELPYRIWECACGGGHLSERLKELGHDVVSTDIADRGYGERLDFLSEYTPKADCILTNPPFHSATDFVAHALEILPDNGICAMFVRTLFLEGQERYKRIFSITPPKYVFQFVRRAKCAPNGDFNLLKGSASAYCWMLWDKSHNGDTIIKWI